MVCAEAGSIDGWNIRSIYEGGAPDKLESTAFLMAFGKIRNIDGHSIMCVMTPAKYQELTNYDGTHEIRSVLIVSADDVKGMRISDSLRIDGQIYMLSGLSRPSGDIVRLELTSHS